MPDFGILILAAGGSTRMGVPKQLLEIDGQTLIRKTIKTALATEADPVVVVLGNAHEAIENEIQNLKVETVLNPDWKNGMSTSLRIGLHALGNLKPHLKSVMILLCDQPLITTEYLKQLYRSFQNSKAPAIASSYENIQGVPAIFEFELLRDFTSRDGDFGARHLIRTLDKANRLTVVPFPEGAIDLDTREDYERFLKGK